MSRLNNSHSCQGCRASEHFDAKLAFDNLAHQQARLGEVVAAFMSQAAVTTDRTGRAGNAIALAELTKRIIGGVPTEPSEFPECCLVGRSFSNGVERWGCTGVLVHPRVVLTAAHCHQPPDPIADVVALNTNDMDRMNQDSEIVSVRRSVSHPNYTRNGPNDICVLILRRPAVTLPVQLASTAEIAAASNTTLVGFGNDDPASTRGFGLQRKVTVDFVSLRRSSTDDLDADEERFRFESDLEFVAGGEGFDSCNGDSGGPAYVMAGGTRRVAGLTSRATRIATVPCGQGGIYTRVDSNIDFVQRVMRDNDIDPNEL